MLLPAEGRASSTGLGRESVDGMKDEDMMA